MIFRVTQSILLAALLSALTSGCATREHFTALAVLPADQHDQAGFLRAERTIRSLFPERYRATQRAILTVGGQQFTCDGLLEVSPSNGCHLAIVSSLGVVTDLRVRADGSSEMLKATPLFREDWSRRFVARDLHRLFIAPTDLQRAGRLADGSLVLQTRPDASGVTAQYVFSADGARWRELNLLQNGRIFYRAVPKGFRTFAGIQTEIPGEFDVRAESYRLQLRIVELTTGRETPS